MTEDVLTGIFDFLAEVVAARTFSTDEVITGTFFVREVVTGTIHETEIENSGSK